MGRRTSFGSSTVAIKQKYEVKIRSNGDRIKENGDKVEGGRIFSRHLEANNSRHAAKRAQRWGKVVSVRKIGTEDVIGTITSMKLEDIIGRPKPERRRDVILDNVTLDEIVYNKNKGRK